MSMLHRWLRACLGLTSRSTSLAARKRPTWSLRRRRWHPTLEQLEDRVVLSLSTTAWTPIGPAPITNGGTPGGLPVSGRITGIAADPSNANTIYIAAAGGGVWKTTDANDPSPNWTPLTDNLTDGSGLPIPLFTGAVTVDPQNSNIIFVGTGESNNSGDSFYGRGILKSTDGGSTWTFNDNGGAFERATVQKIVVNPSNDQIVYAVVDDFGSNGVTGHAGIYKSTDGGSTWSNTTAGISTFDEYSDLVIDPNTPSTLYMTVGTFFGATINGVYKSTNGGGTWNILLGAGNGNTNGRYALAISSDSTNLYVSIAFPTSNPSTPGQLKAFLNSTDGGATFVNRTPSTPNYMGASVFGQGWYDTTLAVAPGHSNEVFAGGSDNGGSQGIIETTNNGRVWSSITSDVNGNGPHTDHHAAAFDANGNFLDGDDGGIFRFNPSTGLWTDLNGNLNTIQFTGIALDPTDPNIAYGGSQDNGTEKYTGSLGWTAIAGGDGGFTRVDPFNPNTIYQEFTSDSIRRSDDGGNSFTFIGGTIQGNTVNFYAPYILDPGTPNRILYGADWLNESLDEGNSWNAIGVAGINGFNPNDSDISAIATARTDSNTIYVATNDGEIFATTSDGASWTDDGNFGSIHDLTVDPTNSQIAYAVANIFTGGPAHVFQTTNGGGSWTDISGNLPDVPVWSIAVDPTGGLTGNTPLYIGTDTGVYRSTDNGATWNVFGTGMPNVQVVSLDFQDGLEILGAGTHGRGLWEISTNDAPVVTTTGTALTYTAGDPATVIDPGVTVTDGDDANLVGATVAITGHDVSTEDVLAFTDQLGITGSFDAATGVLTLSGTASVANYQTALESVTYQDTNSNPDTTTRTVTFTVDDGNGANNLGSNTRNIDILGSGGPVANADSYTAHKNLTLTVGAPGVLGNDTDPNSLPLTAILVTNASHGSVTLNSDGSFSYVPTSGYTGPDSFTYEANNGTVNSNVATVTLTVVDDAPTANADSYTAHKNLTLNVAATGVLANDSDPNGDPITAVLVTNASNGTVTLNSDGSFSYVPNSGFTGTDTFTYEANDGTLNSSAATVTLTVVDDAPTANADSYTAHKNLTLNIAATGVLANDSDPNGDALTAVLVSNASNGTVTLNSDGSFSYAPNSGFTGADSFTYQASDGTLNSSTATVTLTVVNDAPVANDDSYTAHKNLTLNVAATGVLANDSDPNGDPITAVLVTNASNGTVTLNSDGSFSYVPNAGFTGSDSFTYEANDGTLNSSAATVHLTVVDDAPVANDDSYTAHKNLTLNVAATGVLANDSDPNGDPITAVLVTNASNGAVTLNSDGSFSYVPNSGFTGTDSFTYEANDGTLNSTAATVSLTVVDDAPTASDDSYTAHKNLTLNVAATGVLANDSDPNGDSLTAVLVGNASNGSVTLNSDGSFSYTPNAGFTGTDSFTYQASDGTLNSNTATVTLTVVNDAPVANPDSYMAHKNLTLNIAATGVLANDSDPNGDPLTAALVSNPTNGSLTLNSDGSFSYVPNSGFTGTDSFTYEANDGSLNSAVTTVSLTVVNDAPVANDDSYTAHKNLTLNIAATGVLANDSDPNGDPITAVLASNASNGSVTLNSDGSFSYVPNAGFTGSDSFTYEANDGSLNSNIATVHLTVVDDAPVANADSYTAHKNLTLNVAATGVLANDSDPNGDPITAVLVTNASNGAVTLNSDGSFSYVPNAGFTGTDSFTYEANDGTLNSSAATVTLTVVDDAPTAVADSYSIGHNQTLTVAAPGVLGNDSDPNGDTLTAVLQTSVSHGSLTLNSDGSFSYTPTTGYVGSDSFTYQASDGTLNSTTVTVSLSVTNAAPVANADSYSVLHDTMLTVTPASNGVLANDTDADNDPLTAQLVSNASHGSVTLNSDGTFTYTPNAGYTGPDSFTYQANDGFTNSNTATVSISVTDNAPVATNDNYGTGTSTTLNVSAPGVLGNDTDADNDPLTAVLVSNVSNGSLMLNSDGSFTYTPTTGFTGTDTFTYQAFDGALLSNTATVTISVGSSAPVAMDDSYTAHKNLTLTVATAGVLGNDADPNSLPLTAILVSNASNGSVTLNSDGSFSYTPNAGFTGTDSFTYEANNGVLNSNIATVTLTVVNDAPVAMDDSYTAHKNLTLNVAATGVLANDSDPNGDALTAVLVSNASNGTVTLNSDGSFSYVPNSDFTGTDSFTYEANDGSLNSNVATVTLTVVNDAPVANDDSYTAHKNLTLNVAATGVLANDSDPNGDALTAVLVSNASNGSVTLNSDGSFSYTPNAGFTGTDSFTYEANDGTLNSNVATVSLTVVDDAPVANDDSYTAHKNLTLNVAAAGALANDTDPNGDALTAVLVSNASHGTVTLNSDGSFSYVPNSGFTGSDSFTYQASDGTLSSNTATVNLTVINDAPVANDDSYTAHKNLTLNVAATGVLANDSDPNGDPTTAVLVSNASHGSVTLNSDGSFSYTPNSGYTGADSFTYEANDGSLNSNVATVTLSVVDDAPVANDDSYTAHKNQTLNVAATGVLANDSDPNGDALTAVLVSNAAHGSVTLNSDGSFGYTPNAGYTGADSFIYEANDGTLNSNVATVNLTVVDDAPVANDDSYTAHKNVTLTVTAAGVLANDTDPNGDTLTAILVSNASHGTVTLNGNGGFDYTPTPGYTGPDSFTYQASDGTLSSNTATVNLTVVNDAPVANNDNYSILHDHVLTVSAPGVLTNDSDPNGDQLSANLVSNVSHGTLTLNSDGSFTYTPNAGYLGPDSFTYQASDGSLSSNVATVNINVITTSVLTGMPKSFSITTGAPYNGVVASFTDSDPSAVPSQFTVSIRWDASTVTTGTVVVNGSGFDIMGTNTYGIAGAQTVIVTVKSPGSKTLTINSTATVTDSGQTIQSGQSASIAFWNGSNGQTLLQSFGGSSNSTALATWLATTFPNLFGAKAGSQDLTGKTNVEVAALFQTLFSSSSTKLEAEVLATALNVYATTLSLGGTTAQSFGFVVTDLGLGAAMYNVGANGTALGLFSNTSYDVFRLLKQINFKAKNGVIWSGNPSLRSQALNVFDGINTLGGL
jgi:VCBS repeat-containing protein